MADKNDTQQISASEVNDYYEDELARDKEPNNPFEVSEHKSEKHEKREKHSDEGGSKFHALKKWLLMVVIIALIVVILFLLVTIFRRRNDGARYARKLAEGLGGQLTAAQSGAEIQLKNESAYASINQVYPEHAAMAESKKTCKVLGVKLPEWAIICHTEGDLLNTVTYYDYTRLESNPFGAEKKSYIDPNEFTGPLSSEQISEKLNMEPYSVTYQKDGSVQRTYRYCYKDGETGGLVSYIITADFDMAGALRGMSDARPNYVATLLSDQ